MASVEVLPGSAAVRSLTLQSRAACRHDGVTAKSAALPKPALRDRLLSNFSGKQVPLRPSSRPSHGPFMVVAALPPPTLTTSLEDDNHRPMSSFDYSAVPPFTLADIRNAIPKHCFEKNTWRAVSYLAKDVAISSGLAAAAFTVNSWAVWPLYWLAQGTMFWAFWVWGHECVHGSFSRNKPLNDFIGHLTHSFLLIPFHGWRISHQKHHQYHGHAENDESWHPVTESNLDKLHPLIRLFRFAFPLTLLAFFCLVYIGGSEREGSLCDPNLALFTASDRNDVLTSDAYLIGMLGVLAASGIAFGPTMLFKLYIVPYIVQLIWVAVVSRLNHHDGSEDKVPWYRGHEWSYLRGALSTIDRDYGIFNEIQLRLGTHVVHHLFPQIPHYHLAEATEAVKPVLGQYYREPEKSKGPIPVHLVKPLLASFQNDHVVSDEGDILYYRKVF